jgi:hypothetical protein
MRPDCPPLGRLLAATSKAVGRAFNRSSLTQAGQALHVSC